MGLHDFTFYDLICRNARCFGEKPAWYEVDDHRSITFSEFKHSVDRLAAGLQKTGLEKEDRIGVIGKNSLEYFLLYGAAAALGAIMLPINWRLSADEICVNLNDCEPKLLFSDAEFHDVVDGFKDRLNGVTGYFNLKSGGGHFPEFNSFFRETNTFEPPDIAINDGFVIIHTAAVAGKPRGALLSHGNILSANLHFDTIMNLTADDIHLNLLPLFHVGGLFMATSGFHAGALNVNMSKFDAGKAVDLIAAKKVTYLFEFPPILSSIMEQAKKSGTSIQSLRAVTGLDTPDTIEAYQKEVGGTFYCLYGQTETSCISTLSRYDDKPGSAGKMLPLTLVKLVDDADNEVPTGEIGEIVVRGPMVFKGYWNLPEDNKYTFRNGWHHTGDLGRFDEEGFLFYTGRKPEKELIKPGGENVYPAEVEKVVLQHPAVDAVVVFGVPDPKWKEGIKAVCRLKNDEMVTPKELTAFVGERIASYKKPQYVQFIADFPVLEDGSPDRAKTRELYGGKQE